MKTKNYLLILAVVFSVTAICQKASIELTFTAVNNSQNVLLDSIYVENLTQGGDTILYSPDTILVLNYLAGINNGSIEKNKLILPQNFPNPFQQQTSIDLFVPRKDKIKIQIYNLIGQEVSSFEGKLSSGNHSFTFYATNHDSYILSACSSTEVKTIKMLNNSKNEFSQCKLIYNGTTNNMVVNKSEQAIMGFTFALGDELRYIAYAKTTAQIAGSDVVEDAPLNDLTYEFEIQEGIPCPGEPYFLYNEQQYNTVQIGSQCWMMENLNIGIMINGVDSMTDNEIIEKYCYNNDTNQCNIYGGLYQWEEMMQYTSSQGSQGICPEGWHLPMDYEWDLFVDYLGGDTIAGGKIKQPGTSLWNSPNTGATNESGFTALPGGHRNTSGEFWNIGQTSNYWTSTEIDTGVAWRRYANFNHDDVVRENYPKTYAYSVRCIKNIPWNCGDPFHDSRDDEVYNTIEIGTQCWMAENLKATEFINEVPIPNVTGPTEWQNLTSSAYVWYDNDISWKDPYGALYNWFAVDNTNGLCPSGWHVPTNDEWTALTDFIGGTSSPHGNELKSCRQVNSPFGGGCNTSEHPRWNESYINGTDDYGFSGLPGGYRNYYGPFNNIGYNGYWWSSTDYLSFSAWACELDYNGGYVGVDQGSKLDGFSVRCLRDD